MTFYEEFTEKIPLGHLLYILTTGLFTVVFIPYNFFSTEFLNVLRNPSAYLSLFEFFGQNFSPFGNISNLSTDSTIGFTKILLAILIVGMFFYLLRDLFSRINHIPKALKDYCSDEKEKSLSSAEKEKNEIKSIKFAKWARTNGYKRYLDYIWSIRELTLGLLNASVFLLMIILFVSLPCVSIFSPEHLSNCLWLLVFSVCVCLFSGVLYLFHKHKHEGFLVPFRKMFDERKKPKCTVGL